MSTVPILLALLAGLLPVRSLFPRKSGSAKWSLLEPVGLSASELTLAVGLAFPLGAGLLGMSSFGFLLLGADSPWLPLGSVGLIAGACWLLRGRPGASLGKPTGPTREPGSDLATGEQPTAAHSVVSPAFSGNWMLAILALLSVIAVCAGVIGILQKSPHGAWDSWAIWSLRAKFFAGGVETWRNAVDPGFRLSHPEYPVMLSAFLGWAWRLVGIDDAGVPQAAALAYLVSLVAIVGGGVSLLRRASLGLLAIPALLSPIVMVTVPASLYADLPLGATAAAAGLLLVWSGAVGCSRLFALAGIFASLCVWSKEEGILHIAVLSAVAAGIAWLGRREFRPWFARAAAFAMGAAPLALLYVWFRFALAPSSATRFTEGAAKEASRGSGGMLSRAMDLSRYGEVLDQLWQLIATLGGVFSHPFVFLAVVALLLGWNRHRLRDRSVIASVALVILLWTGYLASFILLSGRPRPVLSASLHRLWLHTWPLLVAAVFLAIRAPEDLASPEAARSMKTVAKTGKIERKQGKAAPPRERPRKGVS